MNEQTERSFGREQAWGNRVLFICFLKIIIISERPQDKHAQHYIYAEQTVLRRPGEEFFPLFVLIFFHPPPPLPSSFCF